MKELKTAGGLQQREVTRPKQIHKPVVRTSSSNKHVKSVNTKRVINVFASRLHPATSITEIEECVKESNIEGLQIHEIKCTKMKSRYEHLYMSAHAQIEVNTSDMKRALEHFMTWTAGVFVRRYFPPKQ